MVLKDVAGFLIRRAERRIGVTLDYVHQIARTDIKLLTRYNRLFGFLDPNHHTPALAYHAARLRGAVAADCGTCVEAEINLARKAGIDAPQIDQLLLGDYTTLPAEIIAVATLADAVTLHRSDDPEARAAVQQAYGDAGLIELSFAMNGAALLPGIKRAMGHATSCDLTLLRRKA